MQNSFGVRASVENRTAIFQVRSQLPVIHQITIVRDPNKPESIPGDKGLHVFQHGSSGGGIPNMADGQIAGQLIDFGLVKHIGDQPNTSNRLKNLVLYRYDAGAFLAAMLEGVEAQVAEPGGFWVAVDAHHAALLAGLVVEFVVVATFVV
ncbi:unnamed protein product [Linum trigynum]|uniref:Uncharacterized protein n=1 Tax=Linum trigynum TaxID=586398 RepID=A0AAV2C8V9_9ROSI